MTIRVALIDDQTLVRQGIRGLLELSDAVTVVAEAEDGDLAVQLVATHQPDVLLMDMRMPRMNGAEATTALMQAGLAVPVIILTTFDDHDQVLAGIRAGAKGYLLKGLTRQGAGTFEASGMPEPLTARETEVLRLMAGGYSNKEIAQALSKSDGTIKNHVSHILAKLGVRDRTRAVLKAIEMNAI